MLNTFDIATAWLLRHGRDRQRLANLEGCARYLTVQHELSTDTAERIALQALAELECRNQRARIDTATTTAHVVIVQRPDGKPPLAFTVNDLLRLQGYDAIDRACEPVRKLHALAH